MLFSKYVFNLCHSPRTFTKLCHFSKREKHSSNFFLFFLDAKCRFIWTLKSFNFLGLKFNFVIIWWYMIICKFGGHIIIYLMKSKINIVNPYKLILLWKFINYSSYYFTQYNTKGTPHIYMHSNSTIRFWSIWMRQTYWMGSMCL